MGTGMGTGTGTTGMRISVPNPVVSAPTKTPTSRPLVQTLTRTRRVVSQCQLDLDPRPLRCCPCGRRHLIGSSAATAALLFPILPSNSNSNSKAASSEVQTAHASGAIDKFHPPRPDSYQEFYAWAIDQGMKSYEAQIAGYKKELFTHLTAIPGKSVNVVEFGVGTGPNFKYYANPATASHLNVIGVDPNKKMEKYARAAATAAGLPPANFTFMRGVGEALPLGDNSIDAVIGTLVLCSVKDVDIALKEVRRVLKPDGLYLFIEHVAASDGSFLRLMQSVLDPLQQFVSDGCHLTRETGRQISEVGFSSVGGLKYKQRDWQNYQSFCCISAPFPTGRVLPLIIYRIIRSCNLLCLELKFLNEYYGFSHLEQSVDLFEDRSSAKERNVLALTSYIHGC